MNARAAGCVRVLRDASASGTVGALNRVSLFMRESDGREMLTARKEMRERERISYTRIHTHRTYDTYMRTHTHTHTYTEREVRWTDVY